MKNYLALLKRSPLFLNIEENDLAGMLHCLNAQKSTYPKDSLLLLAGQKAKAVGIVLSGRVQIIKEDYAGNRTIMTDVQPGDLFAESFVCAQVPRLPITAISIVESEVLWMQIERVISSCSSACPFHTQLIANMMSVLARKNILLNQKIDHLSQRTTREKLLSYLYAQASQQKSYEFDLPFSRQELADYLSVDRSAMSAELSRMQKQGLLRFQARHFILPRLGSQLTSN